MTRGAAPAGRHWCPCTDCAAPCPCHADDSATICYLCSGGTHRSTAIGPIPVVLDSQEVSLAEECADQVMQHAQRMGFRDGFGQPSRESSLNGYAAEIGAARVTGLRWNRVLLPKSYVRADKPPDLGLRTEVKTTTWTHGHMVVHEGERDDFLYLFVPGAIPHFTLVGWLPATEVMLDHYWRRRNPPLVIRDGWWVPRPDVSRPLPLPADA